MSDLFIKKRLPVHIVKFEPHMADEVRGTEESPIYYIRTREGMRIIDESMYIATKSDSYRHPMAPEVFNNNYEPYDPEAEEEAA